MSTASDFNEASQVLGGLSSLSKSYPQASAFFSAASIVTGIFGSLFGPSAAKKRAEATEKFRKDVLKGLNHISQQLDSVKSELGSIEDELQKISKQLAENNEERLDILFGYIDADSENLIADGDSKEYAQSVFNSSSSTLYAINTLHEILTSTVFNENVLLQGGLSIPGYMYIRSKILQGLYLMGYAASVADNGRDFGVDFKIWSQRLADYLKTIIQYGKNNPSKADYFTAHFLASWSGYFYDILPNGALSDTDIQPIYCTDALSFSAAATPIMPQKIWLAQLQFGNNSFYDCFWTYDRFINTFNNRQNGSNFNSVWDFRSSKSVSHMVKNNDNIEAEATFTVLPQLSGIPNDPTNYELTIQSNTEAGMNVNKSVFLVPDSHLTSHTGGLYLGSVDGMLNVLPYVSENNYLPLTAFLYDGKSKGQLLQVSTSQKGVELVTLDSVNTMTNCAIEISFLSFDVNNTPSVSIRFISSNVYLNVDDNGWSISESEVSLEVAYGDSINPQPIQSPFDMQPVSIALAGSAAKFGIIHQSPFD